MALPDGGKIFAGGLTQNEEEIMKLTENQEAYKNDIFSDFEKRVSFLSRRNETTQKKNEWQVKAIEKLVNHEWTFEDFSELIYFFKSYRETSKEDLQRLWEANNHKVNIFV
jgi:hypothetical protein